MTEATTTDNQFADKDGRNEKDHHIHPHRRSDLVDSDNDDTYLFEVDSDIDFRGPVPILPIPLLLRLERVLMRLTLTHLPTAFTSKPRNHFLRLIHQQRKGFLCDIHVLLSTMKLICLRASSKDLLHMRFISSFQPWSGNMVKPFRCVSFL